VEKIYQHIEKLLAQHDYVVVPNLGGFVVQTQSAIILHDRITPPKSTVGFNPLMHHSDGLLAIEIAKTEGISYRLSIEKIEQEIEKIKEVLKNQKSVKFGHLGHLYINNDGNVLYSPNLNADFLPANFGISDIYYTQLDTRRKEEPNRITFRLPSSQTFKYAAAGMLVFGLLFISPKVNDLRLSNQADFSTLIPVLTDNNIVADSINHNKDSAISMNLSSTDSAKFHVIVASLPTLQIAEKYCKTLQDESFIEAHILAPSKIYRVAIQSFSNRQAAIEYMEKLRLSDSQFETAWVLCNN